MRHLPFAVLPTAIGCVQFSNNSDAQFAVSFDGQSSCVEVTSDASFLPSPEAGFTIEAWVQSEPETQYIAHPLVVWTGAFALWTDEEGAGHFTDASKDPTGADGADGWMDGELHHVAGTYSNGSADLYLDGRKIAFNHNTQLGASTTSAFYIGCWATKSVHHHGLIDEVRLSNTVRYTDDFAPPDSSFGLDDATIHLWHFDEGEKEVALDEAARADAYLSGVEWVEFSLAGDEDTAR